MFGNKEDKELKRQQKEQEEIQKFIKKYGLEDINPNDLNTIRRIASDLHSNGLIKAGLAPSFAKPEEQAKVTYLSALVEQNWLIINQLNRLNNLLSKLENK